MYVIVLCHNFISNHIIGHKVSPKIMHTMCMSASPIKTTDKPDFTN